MKYTIEYKGKLLEEIEVDDSLNLTKAQFFKARQEVVEVDDFDAFARKWNIKYKAAKSLYGNEVVHMVKKRFHGIKRKSRELYMRWKEGESIVQVARSFRFPPILIARFLLEEMGYSKAEITDGIRNPHNLHFWPHINHDRLTRDIAEAHSVDFVYSSAADVKSRLIGQQGESKLETWLKERGVTFLTEDDLASDEEHREKVGKTPDILLHEHLVVNGKKLKWIESKSLFGTPKEMKRHQANQLEPYVNLFGNGMVVYWHGLTMGVLNSPDYFVVNSSFFQKPKAEENNGHRK